MTLSNKAYDTLVWVAQYLLPGLATLYFALSGIWGLPNTEGVVGTIMAIDVFLGALLGVSHYNFKKGQDVDGYIMATSPAADFTDGIDARPVSAWVLSDTWYRIIKWTVMIVLPAIGTLYFTLSQLWMWPYGEQIVGTIAAITAFSGILLGVSTYKFKNG